MNDFKTEIYSTSKPSFNQYGASTTVWFNDDSYMELEVDMTWCNRQDIVEIEAINADYYDHDDNEISAADIDLTQLVIDICDHFNTFGSVENEMVQAYRDNHA